MLLVAIRWGLTLPQMIESPWLLISNDGRHFVSWLRQMAEPSLFQGDAIAEYFLALTPAFYKAMFAPAVWLGIDPVAWHLLLISPLSILTFLIAVFAFVSMTGLRGYEQILTIGILTAALINDVSLGLPRSFSFTILMGALAAFCHQRMILLALIMFAGANLYPVAAMIAGGAMALFTLLQWLQARRIDRERFILLVIAGISGIAGLALFLLSADSLGETITWAEAKSLPIFGTEGRTRFFEEDAVNMVLSAKRRAGILPIRIFGASWFSLAVVIAVLAGGAWVAWRRKLSREMIALMAALCAIGVIAIALAYLVAFKAHLPARYRMMTLDVAFFLAGALLVAELVKWLSARLSWPEQRGLRLSAFAALLIAAPLCTLAFNDMLRDKTPNLSAALRDLPPDTVVAGLSGYLDNVPSFTGRQGFASIELSVPYKKPYYLMTESRMNTLAALLRGPVSPEWRETLASSGIDVFILDSDAAEETRKWKGSFPTLIGLEVDNVFHRHPEAVSACRIAEERNLTAIDAACFAGAVAS